MFLTGLIAVALTLYLSTLTGQKLQTCVDQLRARGVLLEDDQAVEGIVTHIRDKARNYARRVGLVFLVAEAVAVTVAMVLTPIITQDSIEWFVDWEIMTWVIGSDEEYEYTSSIGPDHLAFFVLCLILGYVCGLRIGEFAAYGQTAAIFERSDLDWRLLPGYPDKAAGWRPIADFHKFQAMILLVPLLWLAIWWVICGLSPETYDLSEIGDGCDNPHEDYGRWREPFLALWILVAIFFNAAFLVPIRRLHTMMVVRKRMLLENYTQNLLPHLRQINTRLDARSSGAEYVSHLRMRQALLDYQYELENAPQWPVSINAVLKLLVVDICLTVGPVVLDLANRFELSWAQALALLLQLVGLVTGPGVH